MCSHSMLLSPLCLSHLSRNLDSFYVFPSSILFSVIRFPLSHMLFPCSFMFVHVLVSYIRFFYLPVLSHFITFYWVRTSCITFFSRIYSSRRVYSLLVSSLILSSLFVSSLFYFPVLSCIVFVLSHIHSA